MRASLKPLLASTVVAIVCCSCRPPSVENVPPPQAPSMVVDLNAVAKAMGWDGVIANRVELATRNLNSQLIQAAESMDKELKQQQAELGGAPTQDQLTAFQRTKLRVQQNIQSNKLVAEQARDSVRAQQILLFRKEIKPVAARIAEKRNANVVLSSDEDVIWFSPSVDITGEVIAALRAQDSSLPSGEPAEASGEAGTNSVVGTNGTPLSD